MRAALTAAGWHDYSLFLREDGLLIGYLETEDFDGRAGGDGGHRRQRAAGRRRWREFFDLGPGARPDATMRPLDEVFHLD